MAPRKRRQTQPPPSRLPWAPDTELVGLVLELTANAPDSLYTQYTVGLHAWFLDQVRQTNPELSAYLHDGQSEKPFTLSRLDGDFLTSGKTLKLKPDTTYRWYITALYQPLTQWLAEWVQHLPDMIKLRRAVLNISRWHIALAPTTYPNLFTPIPTPSPSLTLSFLTPTSFRRKGHHFPLPVPRNLFHSYLRRWNDFSDQPFDQTAFLDWVDENVVIQRHRLESMKVAAGKKGVVTGFTGAIALGLDSGATQHPEFSQLFHTLAQFAPYCGTGHKTPFGLGQTRLGWLSPETPALPSIETLLAERISELTQQFLAQRQRQGGNRAQDIAETWATILARREMGESLNAIADDLDMRYQTVKTYVKLARRAILNNDR